MSCKGLEPEPPWRVGRRGDPRPPPGNGRAAPLKQHLHSRLGPLPLLSRHGLCLLQRLRAAATAHVLYASEEARLRWGSRRRHWAVGGRLRREGLRDEGSPRAEREVRLGYQLEQQARAAAGSAVQLFLQEPVCLFVPAKKKKEGKGARNSVSKVCAEATVSKGVKCLDMCACECLRTRPRSCPKSVRGHYSTEHCPRSVCGRVRVDPACGCSLEVL